MLFSSVASAAATCCGEIVQSLIFIPLVFLFSSAIFYECIHSDTSVLNLSVGGFSFLVLVIFCDRFFACFGFGNIVNFMKESGFLCDKHYNVYECVLCFLKTNAIRSIPFCHFWFISLVLWCVAIVSIPCVRVIFLGGTDVFWIQILRKK